LGLSGEQDAEFALAAEAAGYSFHTFAPAIAFPQATLNSLGPDTPFGKAMLFASDVPPATATTQYPLLKQFNSDIAAEAKSGNKYAGPNYYSIEQLTDWYDIHIFDVVASGSSGPITAASLLSALKTEKNLNVGLQPPWTPNSAGPSGFNRINAWSEYMLKLSNGKLVLAYSNPFDVESFVTASG
jgi:hypothetical protein